MLAIWSTHSDKITGQNRVSSLVISKFNFDRKYLYPFGRGPSALLGQLKNIFSLVIDSISKKNQPEVFYCVISRSWLGIIRDFPIYFFARAKRFVLHIHGAEIKFWFKRSALSFLFKIISLRSECIVLVPSNQIADKLKKNNQGFEVNVLHNPYILETNELAFANEHNAQVHILWNSNLLEEKGYLDFLMAIKSLNFEQRKKLKITVVGNIVGSKGFSSTVLNLHKDLGNCDFVYLGQVDKKYMNKLLAKATHLILPSYYDTECQPLSLIEGMCYGKKIIISDLPALQETLGEYPHYSVGMRDIKSIARTIANIVKDQNVDNDPTPSVRDIKNAREKFSINKFEKKIKGYLKNEIC